MDKLVINATIFATAVEQSKPNLFLTFTYVTNKKWVNARIIHCELKTED